MLLRIYGTSENLEFVPNHPQLHWYKWFQCWYKLIGKKLINGKNDNKKNGIKTV